MSKTYAVYYKVPDAVNLILDVMDQIGTTEPLTVRMVRRYLHPNPTVRRLQDEPVWTDCATADRLAKEYGGTIVFKCPKTGEPLDNPPSPTPHKGE